MSLREPHLVLMFAHHQLLCPHYHHMCSHMAYLLVKDRLPNKQPSTGHIVRCLIWEERMTQLEVAKQIGCDVKNINSILNNRSRITPAMAIKLASVLETSAEFFLEAQVAHDLYKRRSQYG